VYGLAKALVWSPYLYETDAPQLIGQFLLGLAPLGALALLAWARRSSLPPLEWRFGALWVLPYAALALLFFGSDTERWLFVLPALWLVGAVLVTALPRRAHVAWMVVGYLALCNFVTAIWPAHRDNTVKLRAEAVATLFHDGDLVIFPGHSWDEYVSFYAEAKLEPFPLSYYAARDGVAAAWRRLDREAALARGRGAQVWAIRIFESDDEEPDGRGWDQLTPLGETRGRVREQLRARFQLAQPSDTRRAVRLDSMASKYISKDGSRPPTD
jgi:hypothetical protein